MASLNDDFDDDLNAGLSSEFNFGQPVPPKLNFVTGESEEGLPTYTPSDKENPITPEDIFGIGLVAGELPNIDAQVTVIIDKANDLTDQETMARDVVQPCTMCRSAFEQIQEVVTDFKTPDLFAAMYTEQPTQVNYRQTVDRLNTVFKENQVQIQVDLNNVIMSSIELIGNRIIAIPLDDAVAFDQKRKWLDVIVAKIDERSDALETTVGGGKFTMLDFDSSEALHKGMELMNQYITRSYDMEYFKNADGENLFAFTPGNVVSIQSSGSTSFTLRKLVEMIKSQDYFNLLESKKKELDVSINGLNTHLSMDVSSPTLTQFREVNDLAASLFFDIQQAMYNVDVICLFKAFEEVLCMTLLVLADL